MVFLDNKIAVLMVMSQEGGVTYCVLLYMVVQEHGPSYAV